MGQWRDIISVLPLGRDAWYLVREGALTRLLVRHESMKRRWLVRRLMGLQSGRARRQPEPLARLFFNLGPNWIKLGQFLATRHDLLGPEAAGDLAALQDRLQPFDQKEAEAILAASLGKPLDSCFSTLSPPVAAASIAQVHKARLVSDNPDLHGLEVAVKVLRPDIRARFHRDLDRFAAAARLMEACLPEVKRLKPTMVVERLRRSVIMEMDLRLEAAALSEFSELSAGDDYFQTPDVIWSHSGREVLTLSWVSSMPLSLYLHHFSPEAREAGRDSEADEVWHEWRELQASLVAQRLMRSFLHQALIGGLFHADMHPGNLFVDQQGMITGVDFGITERMNRKGRRFLAEILYGFQTGNYRRVAEVHFEAGYVPDTHTVDDFAMACRAIAEPIRGRKASDISMAKLLALLFEITELFDMQPRPELLLLHKSMLVVEGICRTLDREFDMWATAEPLLRDWLETQFRPDKQLAAARDEVVHLFEKAGSLAEMVEQGSHLAGRLAQMAETGIRLDESQLESLKGSSGRRTGWPFVVISLILAGLAFSVGYLLG